MRSRSWQVRLALAAALTTGGAPAALAQTSSIDLRATDGGFTTQTLVGGGTPWTWVAGDGWVTLGTFAVARKRLLSPVFVATADASAMTAEHRFIFEGDETQDRCADAGVVFASVDGGAFTPLLPGGAPYSGVISTAGQNPLAGGGQRGFCGFSPFGLVTSVFSAAVGAGSTVQFAFDGGWGDGNAFVNPNWVIERVTLRNLTPAEQIVPEPSTYALVATGLAMVAGAARRRRGRTR
ncbi:PEP-CTERM sorting domain-containing protein [Roseisolibacter sp. H3M3-2]|uniref:PEP-CTERM sorting domain-containing protein n=1 Tax=Roseisolibacter sp. H3M3-2 TaxID=3031323 RepID=UPI0023DA57EC|nr:PEP-CTERM sorting domain-containing protein [Roseisolibacter sp. H3M3-2]MDF1501381.1 PEP-CTERM sorting domain-containing protein [Roseisolibacter sp. H3M3-2]